MSREIKFRSFLNVADKIKVVLEEVTIYPDGMQGMNYDDFVNDVQGVGYNFDGDHFSNANDSEAELIEGYKYNVQTGDDWIFFEGTPLQFTGLKDKNEKEVYEGDIVDAGYGRAKVVFNSGCFMLEWIYDTEASMEILGIDRNMRRNRLLIEVIGNIYETPELLNIELKDIKNSKNE